jgi:hypothetical protein
VNPVLKFLRFWYDFIVGDDWTVAAGVVLAIGVTALVARGGGGGWWLLPLLVAGLLGWSLWRATHKTTR